VCICCYWLADAGEIVTVINDISGSCIRVLICVVCVAQQVAWMTITTKPSPVGDDAVKQTQSPLAVNPPENPPPSSVPPCTVGSADSVTSPPAEPLEQPSEPDVQE